MTVLITFNNVHDALESEQTIKSSRLKGRLIPVPESIDANCGLALKVEVENIDILKSELKGHSIHWQAIFHMVSYQEYKEL